MIALAATQRRAYGYVRGAHSDIERLRADGQELEAYARKEGIDLLRVFHEPGVNAMERDRPSFTRLLHALMITPDAGVLVPARHHLGWHGPVVADLVRRIESLGAWIEYVEAPADGQR